MYLQSPSKALALFDVLNLHDPCVESHALHAHLFSEFFQGFHMKPLDLTIRSSHQFGDT